MPLGAFERLPRATFLFVPCDVAPARVFICGSRRLSFSAFSSSLGWFASFGSGLRGGTRAVGAVNLAIAPTRRVAGVVGRHLGSGTLLVGGVAPVRRTSRQLLGSYVPPLPVPCRSLGRLPAAACAPPLDGLGSFSRLARGRASLAATIALAARSRSSLALGSLAPATTAPTTLLAGTRRRGCFA